MLQINTFQYNPADVDCNRCAKYGGKEQGCTAKTCPWLAKRIEAGVAGYEEAIRETFPHDAHLDARLRTVVRHFTGSLFLDPSHEQRMEYMKAAQGHRPKRNTPAYYAAMYLLTSDTLRKYFPRSYTPKQMQDTIIKLLDQWLKKRQRQQER